MALFAKILNGNVDQIIIINDQDIIDANGQINEAIGSQLCSTLNNGGNWILTSSNGSIRYNPAKVGDIYDQNRDAFITPCPYPSWILNESKMIYEAPVKLDDGKTLDEWIWDESTLEWKERYK